MARTKLMTVAIARSGDKGDGSNVGIRARSERLYEFLRDNLSCELVADHFSEICLGSVERFEMPNLRALNFILNDSLGGGGTETLIMDAQGKVHGLALLHLEMDIPDELIAELDL